MAKKKQVNNPLSMRQMIKAMDTGTFCAYAQAVDMSQTYLRMLGAQCYVKPSRAILLRNKAREFGFELDPLSIINPDNVEAVKELCKGAA